VAEHHRLTPAEVVEIHSRALYPIYAVGFAPGFCYLGGLDPRLHTPRLPTPRTRVPAGSVGIAEAQTGVYPSDSPGGWRLIGRTPLSLFNPSKADPFLYQAGDRIRFVPISEADYDRLRAAERP
jgi:KipI family sensor histidine kinase inhibitor